MAQTEGTLDGVLTRDVVSVGVDDYTDVICVGPEPEIRFLPAVVENGTGDTMTNLLDWWDEAEPLVERLGQLRTDPNSHAMQETAIVHPEAYSLFIRMARQGYNNREIADAITDVCGVVVERSSLTRARRRAGLPVGVKPAVWPEDVRREAVAMVVQQGMSVYSVARLISERGRPLHEKTLGEWVRHARKMVAA
jgi:hypothetical protein